MVFWGAGVQHKPELIFLLAQDLGIPTRGLGIPAEAVYLHRRGSLKEEKGLFLCGRGLADRTDSVELRLYGPELPLRDLELPL